MIRILRLISRSLAGKFLALATMFLVVPAILYVKFADTDAERQAFLLHSLQVEGRLAAEVLEPVLNRAGGRALLDAAKTVQDLAIDQVHVKLLLRPAGRGDAFFLVAASPAIETADLDRERQRLDQTGVLSRLDASCAGTGPLAVQYAGTSGKDELLTSMSPLHTSAGCWVILTSYGLDDLAGSSLSRPFSEAPEVRLAMLLYALIAVLTAMAVVGTLIDLRSFAKLAKRIRQGGQADNETFAQVAAIPELIPVAGEFDRMVATLDASARAMREAAEDNAHAFKGPIAAMTQSIEPLRQTAGDDPRARQALEVLEHALDRLTSLVQGARRLDEAAAALINARLQSVDMARLSDDMAKAFQRIHAAEGVTIQAKGAKSAYVVATEESLETVLENLLDNAIGFSPPGGTVTLTVDALPSKVRLTVEDEGPGVPPDQLDSIFRRNFSYRPNDRRPKSQAHFGIGLAVVRRTVEVLGGRVHAENIAGAGLRIEIVLPAA
ncbi:sensor histidine kinase [Telmatospirillum siberiense]|uniref:histidine kinase n=1 Tax=Telmatospirillum siberiense TaxID=382514 RepID=A0A2N3PYV4_9PROT|nr:HAMP domain-containing sensor histidine kinase [Telmatospirillum siberiense]PKU25580.1 sensor histidine kinase [Telmatospirillum siberiense]